MCRRHVKKSVQAKRDRMKEGIGKVAVQLDLEQKAKEIRKSLLQMVYNGKTGAYRRFAFICGNIGHAILRRDENGFFKRAVVRT